jgi:hypothetical protein
MGLVRRAYLENERGSFRILLLAGQGSSPFVPSMKLDPARPSSIFLTAVADVVGLASFQDFAAILMSLLVR